MQRAIVITMACFVGMFSSVRGQSRFLAIKDRANAYPSIAAAGHFVAVTWGAATKDGGSEVYVASSTDGGSSFGIPGRVNDDTSLANLSGEQPPRIALVPGPRAVPVIVVTWTSRSTAGTRLLFARSDDGGKSFRTPAVVPGAEGSGNRGWEATATDRNGNVVAVWLDHRELAKDTDSSGSAAHTGHQHGGTAGQKRDGVARAQLSKLFFARIGSSDSVSAVTGGVCYCCKTAVATAENGAIYAAWRHVYPGNVRDIAWTVSKDGGRTFATPARVSEDKWVLDGCPENGPAVAVDNRNRIHVTWPTLLPGVNGSEPTLALFYASSADGRTFTARQRIPTEGFPGHPQLSVTTAGQLVIVWDEHVDGRRRVAMARGTVKSDGTARFVRQSIGSDPGGSYPVVATTNSETIVAWTGTSSGQTVVRVESIRDPR